MTFNKILSHYKLFAFKTQGKVCTNRNRRRRCDHFFSSLVVLCQYGCMPALQKPQSYNLLSINWPITLINNNGGPPLFRDVQLSSFAFFHVSSSFPLILSGIPVHAMLVLTVSLIFCPVVPPAIVGDWHGKCFLLKVGGWKECFPLQSPHHNFDALKIFPPFFVLNAGDSPTGWREQTGTCANGQLIGFMVHLAVQKIACLLLVFNTQFDVNLKTFYIILLHTCTHASWQTECGVMNVISFLWAAGMQNSWEGIYLCQHGRRADYCRRRGKRWECEFTEEKEVGKHPVADLNFLEHMTVG